MTIFRNDKCWELGASSNDHRKTTAMQVSTVSASWFQCTEFYFSMTPLTGSIMGASQSNYLHFSPVTAVIHTSHSHYATLNR